MSLPGYCTEGAVLVPVQLLVLVRVQGTVRYGENKIYFIHVEGIPERGTQRLKSFQTTDSATNASNMPPAKEMPT